MCGCWVSKLPQGSSLSSLRSASLFSPGFVYCWYVLRQCLVKTMSFVNFLSTISICLPSRKENLNFFKKNLYMIEDISWLRFNELRNTIFWKIVFLFCFMCIAILPAHMTVWAYQISELQTIVGCYEGTGNWTQVIWENRQYS